MEPNPFLKNYSSKIKPLYIPLPNFRFFHSPSSEEEVDSKFIGRKAIRKKLSAWLRSDGNTGVYLVTGYRGMGKSSFVGKVLHEICEEPSTGKNRSSQISFLALWFLAGALLCIRMQIGCISLVVDIAVLICFAASIGFLVYNIKQFLGGGKQTFSEGKTIPIKINLGHETLNERDILSLISNSIENKYTKYYAHIRSRWLYWAIFITLLYSAAYFLAVVSTQVFLGRVKTCNHAFYSFFNAFREGTKTLWPPVPVFDIFMSFLFFILSTIVVYGMIKGIEYIISKFYRNNPVAIRRRLKNLNLRIASSTNEDATPSGGVSPYAFGVTFIQRKVRNFPLADVREIEQQLSWILDDISNSGRTAPRFIIVFDEIDKIDPVSNRDHPMREPDDLPEFEHTGSGFIGGATSRRRKQNLLKMLANMKFFISTAKAKFIFIAGRELYDAFLADASDREFAIGSIFNNVIYVDSFLNSGSNPKNVTFKTEQFICKQILPPTTKGEDDPGYDEYYTFKNYASMLTSKANQMLVDKTILMLQHFAVYLAHISTGAPKKISIHFEKYIESRKEVELPPEDETIIVPDISKQAEYYLAFHYKSQQKIGFIHYMAFPLINAILDNASIYGDKLLISGCFLTNHIYKYHNNGFSWRNLENVPELLDVNKSPELREFINIIISYLKGSHLSSSINGLYHFKFPMKISEEISIMSRLSEEVSALFNFTLDDSLSVKNHYTKLLQFYSAKLRDDYDTDLHHVITGIHHILGDLHLLDEQYNEAVFEYQCCVDILLKKSIDNSDPHFPSHIVSLVRIMLKLGLTYEKRKTYNTAYITYNELISKLIQFRFINSSELGLEHFQEINDKPDWIDRKNILRRPEQPVGKQKEDYHEHVQSPLLTKSNGREEVKGTHYQYYEEELIAQFNKEVTPKKNTLIVRLTLFEDIRLIYQTLLARLFVLEKKGLGGISRENIEMLESDFAYLHRFVYYKEKYMIAADFFRKLADILYYKNGLVNMASIKFYMMLYYWDYNVANDIRNYCIANGFEAYEKLKRIMDTQIPVKYQNYKRNKENYIILSEYEKAATRFYQSDYFRLKKLLDLEIHPQVSIGITVGKEVKDKKAFIGELFPDGKEKEYAIRSIHYQQEEEKTGMDIVLILQKEDQLLYKYLEKKDKITISKCQTIIINKPEKGKGDKKHIQYDKIHNCSERRRSLLEGANKADLKNKRTPCYACKYYNRSLRIMMEQLLNLTESDHSMSKALLFIRHRSNNEMLVSLKDEDLYILSSALDGLGNVLFSCSHQGDDISDDFMKEFVALISVNNSEEKQNAFNENRYTKNMKHLEKALLYYWSAAFYFKYSSNMKEAYQCYKKILYLLATYLDINRKDEDKVQIIRRHLPNLKKQIFSRALQNLYSHYEKTNMVEIQKLKWVYSIEMYESLPLNELSIFPDMEELVLLYYRMELICNYQACRNIPQLYKSMPLSQYRMESMVSERILSLRLKAELNMTMLQRLLGYGNKDLYSHDFLVTIYTGFQTYLRDNITPENVFFDPMELPGKEDMGKKLDLIEFLISDSIFSLSKAIEMVSPVTQTSLFTESYIAGIYEQLFECNQVFEFLYILYKWIQTGEEKLVKRMIRFSKVRVENRIENKEKEKGKTKKEQEALRREIKSLRQFRESLKDPDGKGFFIKHELDGLKGRLEGVLQNDVQKEPRSTRWFKDLLQYIGKADVHMTIANYHAEMALSGYRKAVEMHMEGKVYQEMISGMYLLEDDLNNNTSQFLYAVERYANNCGTLNAKINQLKSICKLSSLLDVEEYIRNDIRPSAPTPTGSQPKP